LDAGGAFLAVHQYTSHMTGVVSSMADHLVLGAWGVAAAGVGAASKAVTVNFGRCRQRVRRPAAAGLAILLATLAGLPAWDDANAWWRGRRLGPDA